MYQQQEEDKGECESGKTGLEECHAPGSRGKTENKINAPLVEESQVEKHLNGLDRHKSHESQQSWPMPLQGQSGSSLKGCCN